MPDLQELRAFRSDQLQVEATIELQARRALLWAAQTPPLRRHLARRTIAMGCAALVMAGGGVAYASGVTVHFFTAEPSFTAEPPPAVMVSLDALADYAAGVGETTPSFGGLSLDWAANQVVVNTTNNDPASHDAYVKPGSNGRSYRFVLVSLSYKQLLALRDQIGADRAALRAHGIDVAHVGPDADTNDVIVGVVHPTEETQSFLRRRYGTDHIQVMAAEPTMSFPRRVPPGPR